MLLQYTPPYPTPDYPNRGAWYRQKSYLNTCIHLRIIRTPDYPTFRIIRTISTGPLHNNITHTCYLLSYIRTLQKVDSDLGRYEKQQIDVIFHVLIIEELAVAFILKNLSPKKLIRIFLYKTL